MVWLRLRAESPGTDARFRELFQALGLDLVEATAVTVERGQPPGELLPPAQDDVHVLGIDLEAAADALSQFGSYERRTGSEKWVIDCLATFGDLRWGGA